MIVLLICLKSIRAVNIKSLILWFLDVFMTITPLSTYLLINFDERFF